MRKNKYYFFKFVRYKLLFFLFVREKRGCKRKWCLFARPRDRRRNPQSRRGKVVVFSLCQSVGSRCWPRKIRRWKFMPLCIRGLPGSSVVASEWQHVSQTKTTSRGQKRSAIPLRAIHVPLCQAKTEADRWNVRKLLPNRLIYSKVLTYSIAIQ